MLKISPKKKNSGDEDIRNGPHQRKRNHLQFLLGQLVRGGMKHGTLGTVDVIPGPLHTEIQRIGPLDRREHERGYGDTQNDETYE